MRETFSEFGNVVDVRVFKDKGYAFVKMDSKDAACNAICSTHQTEVNGFTVKCSWGKETGEFSSSTSGMGAAPASAGSFIPGYGYAPGYYGNMGYWGYPPGPGMQQGYPPQAYMQQYGGYGDYGNYGPNSSMQNTDGMQGNMQYDGQYGQQNQQWANNGGQ